MPNIPDAPPSRPLSQQPLTPPPISPVKRLRRVPFAVLVTIFVLGGVLSVLVLWSVGHWISPKWLPAPPASPLPMVTPLSEERTLLVLGVDSSTGHGDNPGRDYSGARSDTMMLVRLDPRHHRVGVVSIPRDSKVYLANNHGVDKINAAHAVGGIPLAVATVEESFGISVDNYLLADFKGLREVVDALGGVTVYVEKPMHYRDRTAGLNIDFEQGRYKLDGRQAESFLRFRHDQLADIGRVRRQQYFLTALAQKLKDPTVLTRMPMLINIGSRYVQTDLSVNQLLQIGWFLKDLSPAQVEMGTLPGHPSSNGMISYWIVDPEAAKTVLERVILNAVPEADAERGFFAGPQKEAPAIQVGILYTPEAAEEVKLLEKTLSARGFTVVCQHPRRNVRTEIIEHRTVARPAQLRQLRTAAVALKNARQIYAPVNATFENNSCSMSEDYTVTLGHDALSQQ